MAKKIIFKLIVVLASACLFSSCAALHEMYSVPYVGLDNGNFTYERTVECSVSNSYLLGIGGFNRNNVYDELKKEACLQDGEVLVNVNVMKTESLYLGLIFEIQYSATADVVRLNSK